MTDLPQNPDADITRAEIISKYSDLLKLEVVQNGLGEHRPDDCSALEGGKAEQWKALGYQFLASYDDGSILAMNPTRSMPTALVFFNMQEGKMELDPNVLGQVLKDLTTLMDSKEVNYNVGAVHSAQSNILPSNTTVIRAESGETTISNKPGNIRFWTFSAADQIYANCVNYMSKAMNTINTDNPELINAVLLGHKELVGGVASPERVRRLFNRIKQLNGDNPTRACISNIRNYE